MNGMRVWMVLLALVAVPLMAQQKGKKTEKNAAAPAAEAPRGDTSTFGGMVDFYKGQLLLSPDVYQNMKDLADKTQQEIDRDLEDLKRTLEILDAERPKDDPDMSLMKEMLQKRAKLSANLELLRFRFAFDCKAMLNPEQVQKWKEIRRRLEERNKAQREKAAEGASKEKAKS
ncbi:MAG: hypothetical protein J0L75_08330 [Spirochaetes bacterium]|nr:hypothetical protein [Spirochaetota bacterium]